LVPGVRELSRRAGLDPAALGGTSRFLPWIDGVEHTALRHTISPWFTPARVRRRRTQVEQLVD